MASWLSMRPQHYPHPRRLTIILFWSDLKCKHGTSMRSIWFWSVPLLMYSPSTRTNRSMEKASQHGWNLSYERLPMRASTSSECRKPDLRSMGILHAMISIFFLHQRRPKVSAAFNFGSASDGNYSRAFSTLRPLTCAFWQQIHNTFLFDFVMMDCVCSS